MCASEVHALLDHNVLRHYTREVLDGREPFQAPDEWDAACLEHARRLNLEQHWKRVHFPFSLSLDNARVHTQSIKTLMLPRVTPADEAIQLHEKCKEILGVPHLGSLPAMLKASFRKVGFQLTKEEGDAHDHAILLDQCLGRLPKVTGEEATRRLELYKTAPSEHARARKQNSLLNSWAMNLDSNAEDANLTEEEKKKKKEEEDRQYAKLTEEQKKQKREEEDRYYAEFFAVWAIGRQAYGMKQVLKDRSTDYQDASTVAQRILEHLEHSIMESVPEERRAAFCTLKSARMEARRLLACQHSQWRCLLPQQLMPLAVATPDLHSPAEVGVRCVKAPVKHLLQKTPTTAPCLLKAATYQRYIQAHMDEKHNTGEDKYTARRCIDKLLCIAKIISAEAGALVQGLRYTFDLGEKNYVPPSQQDLHENMYGTGGGYVTDARFT